jgi:hypothetical protein
MLSQDDVAECEGTALELLQRVGVDFDFPPSTWELALLLGLTVIRRHGARNPRSVDSDLFWPRGRERPAEITLRRKMTAAREAHAIGHELGHWARGTICARDYQEEALCETIGACLACPRPSFARAARVLGLYELADSFHVEQGLALLRVGEVTGRPVLLLRSAGHIARGDTFEWTDAPLTLPREVAHRVRVEQRWGMMAEAA